MNGKDDRVQNSEFSNDLLHSEFCILNSVIFAVEH
jgi:hypothetical protein